MIIIGSVAIKHWYPDFNRVPKDIDFAVDSKRSSGKREVEYLYNPVICERFLGEEVLDANALLTLKMSHLFWDINWDKHMFDVQFLLGKGCTFDLELLGELRKFWENYLPRVRRSRLETTKEEFFTNSVNDGVDEHDNLHKLLAEIPAYTKILRGEVEVCPQKFKKLTFKEKCEVVQEEAMVMAFERYLDIYYKASYKRQLKDNIIKHYPEFIALFAIENYRELLTPSFNFKIKIEDGLQKN